MKPGDIVRNLNSESGEFGLFIGFRTYDGSNGEKYTCSEVMWSDRIAPNGDRVCTIQNSLIEVVNESR